MQAMSRGPRGRRARAVEHREENQHSARPRIKRERSMRDRAMVPDGGTQSAEEHQRHCAENYVPSGKRVKDESDSGGNMNEADPEQYRNVATPGVPPGLIPRFGLLRFCPAHPRGNCFPSFLPAAHFSLTPPPPRFVV